jgi:hypothetical protein
MAKAMQAERKMWSKHYTYDEWMEAQGIPIYRGYYIEDLRHYSSVGGTNASATPRLSSWWAKRESPRRA